MKKLNTPTRPTNIVRIMVILPTKLSSGVRFKLKPTVLKAEITSKNKVKIGVLPSLILSTKVAVTAQQKYKTKMAKAL